MVRTSFSKRRRLTSSLSAYGATTLIATSRGGATWSARYTVDIAPWFRACRSR